jgi:hypothetical protein
MNEALHNDFGKNALEMALVNELGNKASSSLNLDFYKFKIESGKQLDTNEIADKEFWERNLVKIEEKIEFLNAKLAAE